MKHKLILASESPRRKQLLLEAGFQFTIIPSKISEIPNENLNVDERILDISRRKSLATRTLVQFDQQNPVVILSADTEVVMLDRTLGKPLSENHAVEMLTAMSGKIHLVKTGVVFWDSLHQLEISKLDTTEIKFRELSQNEIIKYVKTGEPMDKAGAYGAQGLGKAFIESSKGSFTNVIGLPMEIVTEIFKQQKWQF